MVSAGPNIDFYNMNFLCLEFRFMTQSFVGFILHSAPVACTIRTMGISSSRLQLFSFFQCMSAIVLPPAACKAEENHPHPKKSFDTVRLSVTGCTPVHRLPCGSFGASNSMVFQKCHFQQATA